ncbi:MAG: NAD-dependent epimerase/dehydratase family protein [Beijerinckiaceae bacterium]
MTRRVLVTGATGFVGRHLVAALLADGDNVTALVRRAVDPMFWPGRVSQVECTEFTPTQVSAALAEFTYDVIFHLAAYGVVPSARAPEPMAVVNTLVPYALAGVAARMGAVMISVGTSAEYASPVAGVPVGEEAQLERTKLYGASKAAGGLLVCARAVHEKVPLAHLRLFNVFGPGEAHHRLLPALVTNLASGRRVSLSDGLQVRDFVPVADAVAAMRTAAAWLSQHRTGGPHVWNVATGQGKRVRDVALAVCACLGANERLLGFGDLPMRPDELPYLVGNPSAMAAVCGWRADANFAESLALTVRSLQRQ